MGDQVAASEKADCPYGGYCSWPVVCTAGAGLVQILDAAQRETTSLQSCGGKEGSRQNCKREGEENERGRSKIGSRKRAKKEGGRTVSKEAEAKAAMEAKLKAVREAAEKLRAEKEAKAKA